MDMDMEKAIDDFLMKMHKTLHDMNLLEAYDEFLALMGQKYGSQYIAERLVALNLI